MVVGDAHVFPGFLTPVLTPLSFQSHRILFLHASVEVRGENTPETEFASNRYRTHNYQVTSSTHTQQSHPDGPQRSRRINDSHCDRIYSCFTPCPLFRRWLCGKAISGLGRILCGVLVKNSRKEWIRSLAAAI